MSTVWMVTGSSVGLGRAIVEAALSAGHRVVATARTVEDIGDLAAQYPAHLLALPLDVTSRQAGRRGPLRCGRAVEGAGGIRDRWGELAIDVEFGAPREPAGLPDDGDLAKAG